VGVSVASACDSFSTKEEIAMSPITTRLARKSLFVGSFTTLDVKIDPTSNTTVDDYDFVVPSGLAGGLVSNARGSKHTETEPTLLLLAGYEPGAHLLDVVERASGTVIDQLKYRLTTSWRGRRVGPSVWFSGTPRARLAGSAWGGGPNGPQNVGVAPATGTRRIAVLFVDTSTQRYSSVAADMQVIRDRWMNELINGVTIAGQQRSTRAFYREVSYNQFDISAQVFGPVQLSGAFDGYFNADGTPKGTFFQASITAGDALIDYNQFDTVACITRSIDPVGGDAGRFAWPYASIGHWGPYTTSDGNKNLGVISMPFNWHDLDSREIHETFAHELGHNLGLGDQYGPTVAGRNIGGWDLMDSDNPLPHVVAAHRMILGWVPAGSVTTFNFASSAVPVDQPVTLHAIEQGAPPAGRASAIEVRIADGLNYYFEYRNGESPQIGDRMLPTDQRVLGTDIASAPFVPPFARPGVLLLPSDGDDTGAVLGNGDFYREIDASPFPVEFRADVSGLTVDKADVRIRYGANGRPDPSIRPWPASSQRPWQSPDIEVRNAKNVADPQWANVPWVGNNNTVVAKVKNGGTIMAPQVRVNFSVKNFNIGGAPEVFLGFDVRDVPAGATVEFTTGWVPPSTGHFCVIARIPLYVVPSAPTIVEMTELNNVAQSNYDRFNTSTSSPSTREETVVQVGNPYDQATRVWIIGEQTNPLFRTYVETTWVWLEPGETRDVRVMLEYALDPKSDRLPDDVGDVAKREIEHLSMRPNDLGLLAYAEHPDDDPRHRLELLGGAQIQVTTGRATEIVELSNDKSVVVGTVVTVDDRRPVLSGRVVVTVTDEPERPDRFITLAGDVDDQGFFAVPFRTEAFTLIRAEFLPPPGLSASSVDWIERR
jgi:M6 family metalloprotease-like protein